MGQETEFIKDEGDAWHLRNVSKPRYPYILDALKPLNLHPKKILEVGCGYGYHLGTLIAHYKCACDGLEPSKKARDEGVKRYPNVSFFPGGASEIIAKNEYDIIIFGFCLYVCDRDDLMKIVANADRALREGGHLVIQDFAPKQPHKVPYHHKPGMFTYKMRYPQLWLANPAYEAVSRTDGPEETAVWVIRKDTNKGWQEKEL